MEACFVFNTSYMTIRSTEAVARGKTYVSRCSASSRFNVPTALRNEVVQVTGVRRLARPSYIRWRTPAPLRSHRHRGTHVVRAEKASVPAGVTETPEPTPRATPGWKKVAGALGVAAAGGIIFYKAGIPLPWLLGSMFACTVASLSGEHFFRPFASNAHRPQTCDQTLTSLVEALHPCNLMLQVSRTWLFAHPSQHTLPATPHHPQDSTDLNVARCTPRQDILLRTSGRLI
eukprot:6482315-Pyramimonas_sp.AAC.2